MLYLSTVSCLKQIGSCDAEQACGQRWRKAQQSGELFCLQLYFDLMYIRTYVVLLWCEDVNISQFYFISLYLYITYNIIGIFQNFKISLLIVRTTLHVSKSLLFLRLFYSQHLGTKYTHVEKQQIAPSVRCHLETCSVRMRLRSTNQDWTSGVAKLWLSQRLQFLDCLFF